MMVTIKTFNINPTRFIILLSTEITGDHVIPATQQCKHCLCLQICIRRNRVVIVNKGKTQVVKIDPKNIGVEINTIATL
jgi:hypothetical protein